MIKIMITSKIMIKVKSKKHIFPAEPLPPAYW